MQELRTLHRLTPELFESRQLYLTTHQILATHEFSLNLRRYLKRVESQNPDLPALISILPHFIISREIFGLFPVEEKQRRCAHQVPV